MSGEIAGVPTRFDFRAPLPDAGAWHRVHVLNVAGSGMSGIARLLAARGLAVSGSDPADLPILQALRSEGIDAHTGWDPARLTGVDAVVISSATREDVPELAAARELGLPVLHRAQALALGAADRFRIAVAGANGKTTTSAMVVHALRSAGLEPGYAVGAEIAGRGTNAEVGVDAPFVIEADESDGSFLAYRPQVAVVTNIRPDHLDLYRSFEVVQRAYQEFLATIPDGGLLIACTDDPAARGVWQAQREEGRLRVLSYGHESPPAETQVIAPDLMLGLASYEGMSWKTTLHDAIIDMTLDLNLNVPGEHNLTNAAAAVAVATHGVSAQEGSRRAVAQAASGGLATFAGASRRFQVRGQAGGVTVVDDYAHNPDKVAAVVRTAAQMARQAGRRSIVVFQPHLYSRTRDFAAGFAEGLAPADEVVLAPIFGAREQPMTGVDAGLIAAHMSPTPHRAADLADIPRLVAELVAPGDLVLLVGAGDITTLAEPVLSVLGRASAAGPPVGAGTA